jgi:hypothetical protein
LASNICIKRKLLPMSEISNQIFETLGPDKEIALEFFAVFSRFECALKCCGYVTGREGKEAKPDWDKYADDLEKDSKLKKEIEEEAAKYILVEKPKKQIKKGKKLDWDDKADESGLKLIFILIRRVRNNLFHGGKYKCQISPYDKRRDEKLIRTCLIILYICLTDREKPVTKTFKRELSLTDRDLEDSIAALGNGLD